MKFSCIPFTVALILWLSLKPSYSFSDLPFETTWSSGPYITIFAAVFSICKGVHFIYYNSKKQVAHGAALYLSLMEDETTIPSGGPDQDGSINMARP